MISDFCDMMGGCALEYKLVRYVTDEDLNVFDVVICVRGESPLSTELMKKAKKAGCFVIFFLDDDLLHLPSKTFRFPLRKKHLLNGLKYADGFLTSNQLLAEEYIPLIAGNRWGVLETSISEEEVFLRQEEETDVVKIVYAGASTHVAQWRDFIAPVWPQLAQKYGGRLSLTFVGMHPDMPKENYGAKVTFVEGMPLEKFRKYMAREKFDIGLSPLISNHFTERKYYNKYLEYARCGACGIYSNCPPYTLIIRDRENGFLVNNTSEDWLKVLEEVIENALLRWNCIHASQQHMLSKFTKQNVFTQLAKDFPELKQYKAPHKTKVSINICARFNQKMFRFVERLYLTIFAFLSFGPKETLRRIKNKLK